MKIGDIAAPYILLLLRAAQGYGADTDLLLAHVGLTPAQLRDPDCRIGLTDLMKLGAHTIRSTGQAGLGLEMGQLNRIADLGLPGLLAMTSPTLGSALEVLTRFEPLNSRCYRGNSRFDAAQQSLRFYSIAPYNEYNCFVVDSILASWKTQMEWLSGESDLIEQVCIEFSAPSYHALYQKIFAAPVLFGQTGNSVQLKAHAAELPVRQAEPLLHQQLLALAQERMKQLESAASFHGRVQKIIGPRLHGKTPSLEETADLLGMPDWTLRRKLKEENTTFQALLDAMRRDLALGYMRDTQMSFGEIAYVLGFSSPAAFQRAFKRWAGETPGDYRRRIALSAH